MMEIMTIANTRNVGRKEDEEGSEDEDEVEIHFGRRKWGTSVIIL